MAVLYFSQFLFLTTPWQLGMLGFHFNLLMTVVFHCGLNFYFLNSLYWMSFHMLINRLCWQTIWNLNYLEVKEFLCLHWYLDSEHFGQPGQVPCTTFSTSYFTGSGDRGVDKPDEDLSFLEFTHQWEWQSKVPHSALLTHASVLHCKYRAF